MPSVDIRIYCGIRGAAPIAINRTVEIGQEEVEQMLPPSPSGGAGTWPYWRDAERLVCSILKEELFQDEVTPIQEADDLRRIGVTDLSAVFENEERGMMSTKIIYPE
jgi:hypothetical protein